MHDIVIFLTAYIGENVDKGEVPGDHNSTILLPIQSIF